MKRTPLQRKTPLRAVTPLRRKPMPKKTSRPKRRTNDAYLRWVRTLPCVLCGGPGGTAHHLIGIGGLGGMGIKAPDEFTMPVCELPCHRRIHAEPELWPLQWEWIARTQARWIQLPIGGNAA